MKTTTYQTLGGRTRTVEYDETAPIRIHYAPNETPNETPNYLLGGKTACGLLVRDVMETQDFFTNKASSVECDGCQKVIDAVEQGVEEIKADQAKRGLPFFRVPGMFE